MDRGSVALIPTCHVTLEYSRHHVVVKATEGGRVTGLDFAADMLLVGVVVSLEKLVTLAPKTLTLVSRPCLTPSRPRTAPNSVNNGRVCAGAAGVDKGSVSETLSPRVQCGSCTGLQWTSCRCDGYRGWGGGDCIT